MGFLEFISSSVLDLLYPERCALCGAGRQEQPWCSSGPLVAGLRAWDRPHLCRECLAGLEGEPIVGMVSQGQGAELPVFAAARTGRDLVSLVGSWKYHGLRGLAWPLKSLMNQALGLEQEKEGRSIGLVPIPLHRARRRYRGFNQAEVLSRLVAEDQHFGYLGNILYRDRATGQQAKMKETGLRDLNMAGAFCCRGISPPRDAPAILLVDDLVTSGATVLSAAATLAGAGWEVAGVLTLGLAASGGPAREATG